MTLAENRHDASDQGGVEAQHSGASPDRTVLALLRAGTRRCRLAAAVVAGLVVQTANGAFADARRTVLYLDAPAVSADRATRAGETAAAYSDPRSAASPDVLAWLGVAESRENEPPAPPENAEAAFASVIAPDGAETPSVTVEAAAEAGRVMLAQIEDGAPSRDGVPGDSELAAGSAAGTVRPELGDGTRAPEEDEPTYDAAPAKQFETPDLASSPEPVAVTTGSAAEPSGDEGIMLEAPQTVELASVPTAGASPASEASRETGDGHGSTGPISGLSSGASDERDQAPEPESHDRPSIEPATGPSEASGAGNGDLAIWESTRAGSASEVDPEPTDEHDLAYEPAEGADTGPTGRRGGEKTVAPSGADDTDELADASPAPKASFAPGSSDGHEAFGEQADEEQTTEVVIVRTSQTDEGETGGDGDATAPADEQPSPGGGEAAGQDSTPRDDAREPAPSDQAPEEPAGEAATGPGQPRPDRPAGESDEGPDRPRHDRDRRDQIDHRTSGAASPADRLERTEENDVGAEAQQESVSDAQTEGSSGPAEGPDLPSSISPRITDEGERRTPAQGAPRSAVSSQTQEKTNGAPQVPGAVRHAAEEPAASREQRESGAGGGNTEDAAEVSEGSGATIYLVWAVEADGDGAEGGSGSEQVASAGDEALPASTSRSGREPGRSRPDTGPLVSREPATEEASAAPSSLPAHEGGLHGAQRSAPRDRGPGSRPDSTADSAPDPQAASERAPEWVRQDRRAGARAARLAQQATERAQLRELRQADRRAAAQQAAREEAGQHRLAYHEQIATEQDAARRAERRDARQAERAAARAPERKAGRRAIRISARQAATEQAATEQAALERATSREERRPDGPPAGRASRAQAHADPVPAARGWARPARQEPVRQPAAVELPPARQVPTQRLAPAPQVQPQVRPQARSQVWSAGAADQARGDGGFASGRVRESVKRTVGR